ncbi:MAG: HDOD domain-containing protein [Deltaproteobacteria bacterium]|nr:HDOD domain-containing protein [Deltaproteobacteria bacterium]MBN2673322.1 HDOD domain-containing protein [Deltaproteobacteria bacterium]
MDRTEMLAAIARIETLPSFPDVLLRFQNEMSNDTPDISKLAAIVEDDPSLAARFLKAVNSAYYSRTKPISSISQAINRLGLVETRRLAITTALVDRYRSFGGMVPQFFWTHSIAVALTSRSILELGTHSLNDEQKDAAYLACLLHDIGVIVLFHLFEHEFTLEYNKQINAGGISIENETEQFGINHPEAGEALAKNWNLPEVLYDPIRFHHTPSQAPDSSQTLCRLVHLADFVCNNLGISRLETRIATEFDESAFEEFHLSLQQVPDIIENVKVQAQAAESLVTLS